MSADNRDRLSPWTNAARAAALFAIDVFAAGGVSLRARPGPVRDAWLDLLRELLPEAMPLRQIPHYVSDSALLGGLDLAATFRLGRPVTQRGILARADGGIIVLTSAERASASLAAHIGSALDTHRVTLQRDSLAIGWAARMALLMLDEGLEDERPPHALLDRIAFHIDLEGIQWSDANDRDISRDTVAEARRRFGQVKSDENVADVLCGTASALGIASIRAPLFALRAARAAAALAGRTRVSDEDVQLAAALVLGPRATALPAAEGAQPLEQSPPPNDRHCEDREQNADDTAQDRALCNVIIEAARAAIPPDLLAQLQRSGGKMARSPAAGRAGSKQRSLRRGRPAGVRRGEPRAGARLNVVETLRAAAPWQALRRSETVGAQRFASRRIEVRRDDFRVTRLEQHSETTNIFAVDASGSSALHRLAEAKGAVEQLLADCYIRRDRVALLAFRGTKAELILPPTRSLARAKRSLAGLPGGGGTPLATAIDASLSLADAAIRKGHTPVVVFLTDGRANVARDGTTGRVQAENDAIVSARMMRAANLAALVIDISPQPHAAARKLADQIGARYVPLPYADPKTLSFAVRSAADRTKGYT